MAGRDYRGALYGVSSFVQLVHRWGKQSAAVRKPTVRDWPFLPIRWVHVYLPGRDQLPFAERYFRDFLLRYKWNGLVLEVGGGYIEKDDVRRLVALADQYGLEIVPEIQSTCSAHPARSHRGREAAGRGLPLKEPPA